MVLSNATIVTDNFELKPLDIEIEGEKIVRIGEHLEGDEKIDLSGKYILPGFIDVHIHGACGVIVSDENPDIQKVLNFEATQGVTGIAFSLAVCDFDKMLKQIDVGVLESTKSKATKILAINAEGPFLSKKYKGCMQEENIITPDIDKLKEMIRRSKGLLKIVAVAPEEENAMEFIQYAVKNGIAVSIGHTNANYEETMEAIEEGATQAVHTFNAMRPLNHRDPGVLGAVLTDDRVNCEVICDYIHLHPVTVDMIYRLKGADHMIVVSDSVSAAGIEVEEFEFDGRICTVKDGAVRLPDGTISGSARTLLDGVQHLIKRGIPITDVSKMASYNPAKSINKEHEVGTISVGKYADLVVLDSEYNVHSTFINGVRVYNHSLEK